MAITYDWFENPKAKAGEETTLHIRPCFNGTDRQPIYVPAPGCFGR